ncbi:unnamed protein product [Closterium sp. Naga37s-1]|nr:unnamed protein product [Closterium sp. Naga37s-1]
MDGGVLSKAGAMAAIAESEVFESGDEDEESRVLWQIMMIEEAAREAAARQPAEVAVAEVAVAEVAVAETATEESAKEESAESSAEAESAETKSAEAENAEAESAEAERVVVGGAEAESAVAESAVVVTPTATAIVSDTSATAIAPAPSAETAESLNAPSSSSNGGGVGGGIRKSTSASGLFSLESATGTTPNSDTVTPVSTSTGAAPHKDAARAANSGGTISKSTSTGALSSLISARSFRIRGKSSGGGLPFLPALTVPESDPAASADHGPLSCSALPSAAPTAPSGGIAPPLTPSRRFSKWFSFKAADKAQASSGDNNATAAKSSAQFLSGKPTIGGFGSAAVSDSSEVVSLGAAEPIAECESEEGRGSAEGRSAAEETDAQAATSKPKDSSGAFGLVSPKSKAPTHSPLFPPPSPLPHMAPAKPTKAQIKAELQKMANAITKKFPQYAKYAKDINKYIGLALNSKYDFTALSDATLLLPSDTEAEALAKKVPVNKANIPRIYNITAYHIIRKKYTVPALKVLKKSQPIGTQLKQAMYKVSQQNGNTVSFAKTPNAPPAAWTTIKIVRLYAGPYFIAHGVDKVLVPTNTKV